MSAMASDFLLVMKKYKTTAVAIGIVLFLFSRFTDADPMQQLTALLKPLTSLDGRFQQTLTDDKGEVLQVSSGVFSLQRPGFFRWQTLEPFPQLLVSNQQTIWLYDEDLEQVIVRPYTEAVNNTPALLLSGDISQLSTYYQIARQSDNDTFILTSKNGGDENGLFTRIALTFSNQQLSQMVLTDTLGQVSLFRFTNLTVNPVFAENLFTFDPPPGVDVIVDD